jgi:hypothetical protein
MSAIQPSEDQHGFKSEDVHLLASIKYWGIREEADKSESYSRVRKHFMSEADKSNEQKNYSCRKKEWSDQWYGVTAPLLGLDSVISKEAIKAKLRELNLSEAKKNALCVELATFTPYHELKENSKEWDGLSFNDQDRKLFLESCSKFMGETQYTLWMVWQEFNRAIEKIVKSNSGPNLTWMWVGLGAAALLIAAPYMAGFIGGIMGFSGAAATSAGLAFLGGGSLAAGGLGMSGGYVVLMAGGAILGYGSGTSQYQERLRKGSKEELLINCSKLFAASKVFNIYREESLDICRQALHIQNDLEREADDAFLSGKASDGKQLDSKALIMRAFRRLLRGDI